MQAKYVAYQQSCFYVWFPFEVDLLLTLDLFQQGYHAVLYGEIVILAENTPLPFDTCDAFLLLPEKTCLNPPRSNTWVTEYTSGEGARCDWTRAGPKTIECDCHSDARLDPATGNCVCSMGYFGNGRWFCHPTTLPRSFEMSHMGNTPVAREGHSFVLAQDMIWLFGGITQVSTYLGDLHCMQTRQYAWVSHGEAASFGGPSARAHHAAASWMSYMYVHGGFNGSETFNDFFVLHADVSPPVWTDMSALPNAPSPRSQHVAAVATKADEAAGFLYLFGGVDARGAMLGDMFEFSMAAMQWKRLSSSGTQPPACKLHTMSAVGNFLYLLGGDTRQGQSKLLYLFNSVTSTWTDTQADKQPDAPSVGIVQHTMTKVRRSKTGCSALSVLVELRAFEAVPNTQNQNFVFSQP